MKNNQPQSNRNTIPMGDGPTVMNLSSSFSYAKAALGQNSNKDNRSTQETVQVAKAVRNSVYPA